MPMEFLIEFFETEIGCCPVRDFLEELRASDPNDFAAVMAGLTRLRNRDCHREPLAKAIGNELFELRHIGKLNTRVFWFYSKGRRILVVHGIRNKAKRIRPARFRLLMRECVIGKRGMGNECN